MDLPPAWAFAVAGWMLIYLGYGFWGVMLVVVFAALRLTAYERRRDSVTVSAYRLRDGPQRGRRELSGES